MGLYSKEKIEEIKSKVRQYVVADKKLSARKIAELLNYDRNFINKIKRKIEREISLNIDSETLKTVLGEYKTFIEVMRPRLLQIFLNESLEIRERLMAFNSIIDSWDKIINKMFDAGVFKRDLGEVDVRQISVNIIKNADRSDNNIPAKL